MNRRILKLLFVSVALLLPAISFCEDPKPGTPEYAVFHSNKLYKEGKTQEAMDYLNSVIPTFKQTPENKRDIGLAYYNRGWGYYDLYLKNPADAKKILPAASIDFDRALELYPEYTAALVYRAMTHISFNRDEQAMADLNLAISKDPKEPYAYFYRGTLYKKQGKTDLAVEDFKNVIANNADEQTKKDSQALIEEMGYKDTK